MDDNGSYIIKPKDASGIVKLQDPAVIEQLLDSPLPVLAEVLTGWFASGNGFWAAAGLRVAQAAFKGRVFQQFANEFKELRERGRIPEDFAEKKNGYNSWVELLSILDSETPDEERLEALKAMFFAVNKVEATDADRILNYQLFQIAKKLTSGELLLLKAVHDAFRAGQFPNESQTQIMEWANLMANRLGHGLSALVLKDHIALEDQGLITPRIQMASAPYVQGNVLVRMLNARITDLGIRFCDNLENYHIEVKTDTQQ